MTARITLTTATVIFLIVIITSGALAQGAPPSIVDSGATPTGEPASDTSPSRLPAANLRPGIYAARDWRYLPPDVYPIVGGHQQYTWEQIEIRSNTFDWSALDTWLMGQNMQGKAAGLGFVTYQGRLAGGIAVPSWFKAAYPSAIIDCGGWEIPRYWNSDYLTFYRRFLQAAANRYNGDPRVNWLQIGIGVYGENQPADDDGVAGANDTTCIKNALSADFGIPVTDTGALSAKWVDIVNQITAMHADVWQKPLFSMYAPSFIRRCERLDTTNYAAGLTTGTIGLFAAGLLADQNDVIAPFGQTGCGKFDPIFTWNQSPTRTVPTAFETYQYMLPDTTNVYWGVLSALNKHVDILNLNSDLLIHNNDKFDPAGENFFIYDFASRFLGATLDNTPEVWIALREHDPVHTAEGISAGPQYRNYNFWLYQDENAPGGRTVTATTSVTSIRYDPILTGIEGWSTRRTDHASGNDYMFFNVDDGYLAAQGMITITYFNHNFDSWRLEYKDSSGATQTRMVNKTNTNTWQKASFMINDIRLNNDFAGNDFRIYNMGDGDEYIHMVEFARVGGILPTPTRTLTPSATATSSATGTPSPTSTATVVPSSTPKATPTQIPVNTATRTPTATSTPTASSTATNTSTPTQTRTSTRTYTPTQTSTVTRTPTQTPTPTWTHTRTATPSPTATATQTIAVIAATCDSTTRTYSGNTQATGSRRLFTYMCGTTPYGNEWGPEHVYRFTTSATSRITARLLPDYQTAPVGDPDVFLLTSLDATSCLPGGYGDMAVSYTDAPPGTYYVAVDGWIGWAGSYTLELTCLAGPTPTPTATPQLRDPIYIPIIMKDW